MNPGTGLEYAPRGLIGGLTAQGNTTVEPELSMLWPPGYAMITARLFSPHDSITERHRDYWTIIEPTLDRFANAPLSAAVLGVTGMSYLAGKDEEDRQVAGIEDARGYPFVTCARAITDALRALGAERIGLVSPYPADMTEASTAYWSSRGFTVAQISGPSAAESTFHPIYGITASSAHDALSRLRDSPLDAIVMLGTGMPTLAPIAKAAGWDGPPVMSSVLCLAWRAILAIEGEAPSAANVMRWINGTDWTPLRP